MKKKYAKAIRAFCVTAHTTKPISNTWLDFQPEFYLQLMETIGILPPWTRIEDIYSAPKTKTVSGEINGSLSQW